ncbi:UDP-2,4-diacetamido-2,4,6-trideoxy-beta-L-altropyranose hydrolase, partial [Cylindrospermopsis raciborskii CS-506_C]
QQIQQRPRTNFYENLPHLAQLMAHADLAIGAGGTTTWERLCLGLPSLVISIAENQVPACLALSDVGAIIYLGTANTVKIEDIQNSISSLFHNTDTLEKISYGCRHYVDGLGAKRLAEYLKPTHQNQLRL